MDRKLAKARTEASYSLDWWHRANSRRQAQHRARDKRTWHRAVRRSAACEITAELEWA